MIPKIYVSGMGAVTPAGVGIAAFWQALLKGESILKPVDFFPGTVMAVTHGGQIDATSAGDPSIPKSVGFAVAAAREALAPLSAGQIADCALIAATNFGANCPGPQDFAQGKIADILGIKGIRATVSLSCSSGASALAYAADMIEAGRIDRALVVGFDELSPFSWSGLCALRTMTRESVVRPFDAHRSGTLFSEGAAAILVESAAACKARNGAPLAVLAGWATGSNGYHLTAPAPRGAGSLSVMRRAIEHAGAAPADIDYFNAHGTGTKHNDLTETQAFQDLCGDRANAIPVSSVKGTVGHLLGAAGTAEVIATVMAVREGVIPPTANLAEKDPECPLDIVCGAPRKAAIKLALSNSAGIGGCNGAVAIRALDDGAVASSAARSDRARVVVTGIGILSPLGIGDEENRLAMLEGEPALEPSESGREEGRVPPFGLSEFVPTPKNYLDRQSELLLSACGMAIAQAGGLDGVPPERRAVCAGTVWGGSDTVAAFRGDLVSKGPRLVKPMLFQHAYTNTAASLVATEWEMRGPHLNFTTERLASSQALLAAIDSIASGDADIALACAAESLPQNDGAQSGHAFGEAGVALFIETEEHAIARGAKPLARILSGEWQANADANAGCAQSDPASGTDALCGDTQGAAELLRIALDVSCLANEESLADPRVTACAVAGGQCMKFCLEIVK